MNSIVIQFPVDDLEFRSALEEQFKEDLILAENKSFDGMQSFQAIISIALPLAPYIVEYLIGYLQASKKRVIITPEGEVTLINYTEEEASSFIESLAKSKE